MSPSSTGHQIPPAPTRIRKRKSPPQPRSGILAQPNAPAPAVEASRPSKAAPEAAAARPRAPRITVAALAAKIQAQEARIQELETHMAETIIGYEARIDSLEIKLAGAQRTIGELTAAAEVASVMSRPVAGTIKELGLVQAKPEPKLEPKPTKEPAVPAAAKSYANTLIWGAVILASLLIWAVASRSNDDAPAAQAPVVRVIHDTVYVMPKMRKATMADFETDAERARRLDSLARVQKLHDEGF